MLPKLVGARRDISDVDPLTVKMSAIEVTTILGNTLVSSSTTVTEEREREYMYTYNNLQSMNILVM